MKHDLRVRFTQQVIQDAFWKLLREKPLSKITVKEVCTLADINRSTFYRHYLDCYDLMEKLQEERLAAFERLLEAADDQGIDRVIVSILEALREDDGLYLLLKTQGQSEGFLHRLIRCCYRYMEKNLSELPAVEREGPNRPFNDCFLISGSCGIIEYWMHMGLREPPEEIAEQILRLSESLLRGIQSS